MIGSVRDSAGVGIPLAQLSAGSARTITDTAGRYLLNDLPGGSITILVRRLGFAPASSRLDLVAGRVDSAHFILAVLAERLPELSAEADARERRRLPDFYRHRTSGNGYFFNRRELDSLRVNRLSDVLRRLPGIRLMPDRTGRIQLRMGRSPTCPPDFWIDGQPVPHLNVDDVPLPDVEALEIYRGAPGLPPEYNNRLGNPGCGAVVIWTRLPG